ncbi:MAG TPA: acetyl-coenzyme A synthetase N-terminal domain-containing protein, partial [Solirubrobacteraceae bacterium]
MTDPPVLWTPSKEWIERTTLTRYQAWVEQKHGLSFGSYEELWEWSVRNLDDFWSSIVEYFDVRFGGEPQGVLGSREMPGAQWFPGATVNFAEHLFRDKDD